MVDVFREVKRVLKDDGTLWLNLGDSYAGSGKGRDKDGEINKSVYNSKQATSKGTTQGDIKPQLAKDIGLKPKDLVGIPWRVAFALQADGWYLRQDIIWHKPNPMPESVTDRCTKAHEYIFLLSKSQKYYYDNEAIKEKLHYPKEKRRPRGSKGAWDMDGRQQGENGGGETYDKYPDKRNKRSVWTVTTKPFKEAHYATFPPDLIIPCIKAGCPEGGIVLDPFMGSGTTAETSLKLNRKFAGIELNPDNVKMSNKRIEHIMEQGNLFI